MPTDGPPSSRQSPPAFFERAGERILLLMVGPLDKVPELYARGRWPFVTKRAAAYATVMTLGLVVLNFLFSGPMFRAPVDATLLGLRLASYWAVQFLVGAVLVLFIWRAVERIAQMKRKAPPVRQLEG